LTLPVVSVDEDLRHPRSRVSTPARSNRRRSAVGLIIYVWDVYFRRPVTEHDIEQELKRIQR